MLFLQQFWQERLQRLLHGTAKEISDAGTRIVNAILWAGYAISLGMVVFIGIKYILGSAEAKSNMKSAIVNWFIGAFIVFMCTTIAKWVVGIAVGDGSNLAENIVTSVTQENEKTE